MSKLDTTIGEDLVQMYEAHTHLPDGSERIRYAYGAPWIAMALYMDDIAFDTPEQAKEFWEKEYGQG